MLESPSHGTGRLYLMNSSQIKLLGKLFGEVLAGDKSKKI